MELYDLVLKAFEKEPRMFIDPLPPAQPEDGDIWFRQGEERFWMAGSWHPSWDGGTQPEVMSYEDFNELMKYQVCKSMIYKNGARKRSEKKSIKKQDELLQENINE